MVPYPSKNKQLNIKAYTELMNALIELTCFGKPFKQSGILQKAVFNLKNAIKDLRENDDSKIILDSDSYKSLFFTKLIEEEPDLVLTIINDKDNKKLQQQLQETKLLTKQQFNEIEKLKEDISKSQGYRPSGK